MFDTQQEFEMALTITSLNTKRRRTQPFVPNSTKLLHSLNHDGPNIAVGAMAWKCRMQVRNEAVRT